MKTIAALLLLALAAAPSANARPAAHGGQIKDESTVEYTLHHPLHGMTAVSRQPEFRIDLDSTGERVTHVAAAVDVTSFDSGNSNRDSHAMEVIDAIDYPEAKFTSTSVVYRGDTLDVAGTLEFHGVTRGIVARASTRRSGDTLEFIGGFTISMTDFKIERPSLLMIPVDDTLRFGLKAVFAVTSR